MQIQQFYTLNQIIIDTLAENPEANNYAFDKPEQWQVQFLQSEVTASMVFSV